MPSPFPGMDPYLEQAAFWSSFHFRLIGAIVATIEAQLSLDYYVEVETRTYQNEEVLIGIPDAVVLSNPATRPKRPDYNPDPELSPSTRSVTTPTLPERVSLPMPVPIQERYLEVRDVKTNAAITVIEVLSPKNKRPGEGRIAYEKKRRTVLDSATHFVEIDLLCAGQGMPIVGVGSAMAYRILVSRSEQRPEADLYNISLQQCLPSIPIPLKLGDPDICLDLQASCDRIYEEARYGLRLDYQQPIPPPALSASEQQWVATLRPKTNGTFQDY